MPDVTETYSGDHTTKRPGPGMVAPRRISIITGSLLRYDAISECAFACLEAVACSGRNNETIEARIYCLESNISDSRVHVVDSVQTLVADPFLQASDIIIHHFGIVSELHGVLALAPRSAYVVVQFYGVTPPQFMPKASEGIINDSFIQIGLFENADEIVVNSGYLASELRRIGLKRPMRQIELFGMNIGLTSGETKRSTASDQLNVVYCGRFVESKQVLPLLEALDTLSADFPLLKLTLVGVPNHSDGGYFEELRSRAAASSLEIVFELNRSADQVVEIIGAADLLVLPSLHEGFGMPIAEALSALTPVVCSDAGSLPEVAGGLAILFKSSDLGELSTVLHAAFTARLAGEVMTENGRLPYAEWADQARSFSAKYHRKAFIERWRATTVELLTHIKSPKLSDTAYTEVIGRVFPDRPFHDPGEAQLIGRFVTLKALGRMDADPDGMIDVLYRWACGRPADGQDMDYWRGELDRCRNLSDLIGRLTVVCGVRSSPLRLRSLTGINATLLENATVAKPVHTHRQGIGLPEMKREEVEYVLKRSKTPLDFVKSAYVLILGRQYDSGGLEIHIRSAINRDNWDRIIEAIYSSEEYRHRREKAGA